MASTESSAHINFKCEVLKAQDGDTQLTLKELAPVRLIKNQFFNELQALYQQNPTVQQLKEKLGRGRAKKGMFEGDLQQGELEIGQIAGLIHEIKPAADIVKEIVAEFKAVKKSFC